MLQANFMALCFIEPELLPIEVIHCRNMDFRPFCSCDLDLDPITFIYKRYTGYANINFLRQSFLKLSADRQTDRQTDTSEIIYHAASLLVKNTVVYSAENCCVVCSHI